MRMTADKERGVPAKTITWTSTAPPPARHRPEDIMHKGRSLSQVMFVFLEAESYGIKFSGTAKMACSDITTPPSSPDEGR
jgi:hypothetical protein